MIYMIRYRNNSQIEGKEGYEGESVEDKVKRITEDKEGISEPTQLIYTSEKDGVLEETDIRTDKWDLAVEALDIANKVKKAQGEDKKKKDEIIKQAEEGMKKENQTIIKPENN